MSKTAMARHHAGRVAANRAKAGHWLARVRPEGWQNILARTPCRCSCFMCRSMAQQRAAIRLKRAMIA